MQLKLCERKIEFHYSLITAFVKFKKPSEILFLKENPLSQQLRSNKKTLFA